VSERRHNGISDENPEDGFLLLAVVVMAAIVLIGLAVAAPIVAKQLRRDREVESEHRAQDYVRAIQLYYRKNNGYPASLKALESTNNVRYLREKWVDPLTGKSDWRIIHQGEQKTTIKGFFGQELQGIAGGAGGLGSAAGLQSSTGGTSTGTSINSGCNASNTAFCSQPTTTSTTGSSGSTGASGATGSSGTGMFGDSTGGIIVGVGTSATGDSILTPNQQTTYETWEFWYDPRIELLKKNVNILGGGISTQTPSTFGQGASGATGSTGPFGSGTGLNPSPVTTSGPSSSGPSGSTGALGSNP
jgi:type II secretory pathway pseudopilin PulG